MMMQMEEEEEYGSSNDYYVQSPSSSSYSHQYHHHTVTVTNPQQVLLLPPPSYPTISSNNNNKLAPVSIIKMGKLVEDDDDDDDDEEENNNNNINCLKYFSLDTYPCFVWIGLQLLWRLMLSAMLALLVFYLVTRPPPPHFSLKVIGVKQFEVTQGVDLTGVTTTYLSCNISMALIIDNRSSKVFGLHTMPPLVHIYFADRVPFVMSQGEKMYVRSREWREMWVSAGTNKKPMYGGGSTMVDMLYSQTGLPLSLTLQFNSYITVLPNLIHSHFHHQAHCFLLLRSFNKHHHSSLIQSLNTTCNFLTS